MSGNAGITYAETLKLVGFLNISVIIYQHRLPCEQLFNFLLTTNIHSDIMSLLRKNIHSYERKFVKGVI